MSQITNEQIKLGDRVTYFCETVLVKQDLTTSNRNAVFTWFTSRYRIHGTGPCVLVSFRLVTTHYLLGLHQVYSRPWMAAVYSAGVLRFSSNKTCQHRL